MLLITPLDIQNKEFKRSFRGYNTASVDSFLDDIIEDYERIYKENIELKEKIELLTDQIRQYNTLEETLKNTLVVAQTTADEVTSAARQKADNIIENAEMTGQRLIDLAKEDVREIKREYEYLRKEMFTFKTKYQSFIEAQLIALEKFYSQMEMEEGEQTSQEDVNEAYDKQDGKSEQE